MPNNSNHDWEALSRELLASIEDVQRDLKYLRCAVKELKENWEIHSPLLDRLRQAEEDNRRLRSSIRERLVSSTIWAFMIGTALAVWEWVKNHAKPG